MSEYWVSKKKYFCKYCEIYIADDVPSRQHHENGLRHKGNRERFIRGLYKDGEKRKKDSEEEKREMARIELVGLYSLVTPCTHSNSRLPKLRSRKMSEPVERKQALLLPKLPLPNLRNLVQNLQIHSPTTLQLLHLDLQILMQNV